MLSSATMGSTEALLRVAREGLLLAVVVSAPVVAAALVVGLLVGLLQATTQIQEQTLTFVPKLVAVTLALLITGPWMSAQITRFFGALLEVLPRIT